MRLEGLPDAPRGTVHLLADGWWACAGTDKGVWYFGRVEDPFCSCKSYEHRRACYHLAAAGEAVREIQRLSVALEAALKRERLPDQAELKRMFG